MGCISLRSSSPPANNSISLPFVDKSSRESRWSNELIPSLQDFKMACSSRISRIIPTTFSFTLDSLPADFSPFPSPSPAFTNAMLVEDAYRKGTRNPGDVKNQRPPSSPMPETPLILSPISPVKKHSQEGEPFESRAPTMKHTRPNHEARQESSKDHRSAPSQNSLQKRNDSSTASSLTSPVRRRAPQDALKRNESSPTLTTSQDRLRRMVAATRVRRRHSRQDEHFPPDSRDDINSHSHRYNHIVRTDALAPNHAQRSGCDTSQPPTSQRQSWLKDNREIDWARYFRSQPLPNAARWSRLGATVHHVDGAWTGSVRLVNP
jgi:hypothetical protein